jgi:hypothetical protein
MTGQINLLAPDIRPAQGNFVGAMVSVHGKDEGGTDAAVWLDAARDEQLPPLRLHSGQAWLAGLSPAQATMATLRQPWLAGRGYPDERRVSGLSGGAGAEE